MSSIGKIKEQLAKLKKYEDQLLPAPKLEFRNDIDNLEHTINELFQQALMSTG